MRGGGKGGMFIQMTVEMYARTQILSEPLSNISLFHGN